MSPFLGDMLIFGGVTPGTFRKEWWEDKHAGKNTLPNGSLPKMWARSFWCVEIVSWICKEKLWRIPIITSWWFQPLRRRLVKMEIFPQIGNENKIYLKAPTRSELITIVFWCLPLDESRHGWPSNWLEPGSVHSLKPTQSLKNGGWETIRSFWVSAYFSGSICSILFGGPA